MKANKTTLERATEAYEMGDSLGMLKSCKKMKDRFNDEQMRLIEIALECLQGHSNIYDQMYINTHQVRLDAIVLCTDLVERHIRYQRAGAKTRGQYISNLAKERGISEHTVRQLAHTLGESEDFDGLLNALDDIEDMGLDL